MNDGFQAQFPTTGLYDQINTILTTEFFLQFNNIFNLVQLNLKKIVSDQQLQVELTLN